MSSETASDRSSPVAAKHVMCAVLRSGMAARMHSSRSRRASSFSASIPADAFIATQQRQTPSRVVRGHTWQQMQVIVNDRGRDRFTRHVHHARAGEPKQHQHAKKPLLVVVRARQFRELLARQRHAWHDDDRAFSRGIGKNAREQWPEALLDLGERAAFIVQPGLGELKNLCVGHSAFSYSREIDSSIGRKRSIDVRAVISSTVIKRPSTSSRAIESGVAFTR